MDFLRFSTIFHDVHDFLFIFLCFFEDVLWISYDFLRFPMDRFSLPSGLTFGRILGEPKLLDCSYMIGACILGGSAPGVVATFGGGRVRSDNRSEGLRRPNGAIFVPGCAMEKGVRDREKSFLFALFVFRLCLPRNVCS